MPRLATLLFLATLTLAISVADAKMAMVSDADCVKRSPLIVIGKITAVADAKGDQHAKQFTITVSKTLKGKSEATIELAIVAIARNTMPAVGDEKIFFLTPGEGGTYLMAVASTLFSVRSIEDEAKFTKLIEAENAADKK